MICACCGKPLTYNENGLNRKYNNGEVGELCMACLAVKLGVTTARLEEKIKEFLAVGCLLFAEENK